MLSRHQLLQRCQDGACRRASHLGMLPWLRGQLLLLSSGLLLVGETPALLNSVSVHRSWILLFEHTCLLSLSSAVSNLQTPWIK